MVQEVERFNLLLRVIKDSMENLVKAIEGEIIMSEELDMMQEALLKNVVPKNWENYAYPSMKALNSWYTN